MFTRTALSASVFATLASAGPIMMRQSISIEGDSGLSSYNSDLFGSSISSVWPVDNSVFDSSSISLSQFPSSMSFDHFGSLSSLSGFDNFYGADNFCGSQNEQVFSQTETVTCQTSQIDLIQQQLAILAEYAKEVVLTNICEVETQTIVVQQWLSTLQVFSSEIRHVSESSQVTFDSSIASHISDVCNSDGSVNLHDFGFSGTDIGSDCVTINGLNWNDQTSPSSVESAFSACQSAAGFSISPPTISSVSSSCGSSCDLIPPSMSSCDSSDCGSSSISELPPSSCDSSDCGSSSISSLPPTDSSCDSSDCGSSSISSLPPTDSSCDGSDCGSSSISSLPPTDSSCDGSDCGSSSISSLPPSNSSCDSSDCGGLDDGSSDGSDSSDVPPVETDSSGDIATDSSGDIATDSSGDIATDGSASPTDSADSAAPTDDSAAPVASIANLTPVGAAPTAS